MKIKKAVIAAAGRGTRFLPTVKAYPKELVPILSKPNIQYLVEELIGAGIEEICIVHRHGDNHLKKYFSPDKELEEYLRKTGKESFLDSLRVIWKKVRVFRFLPQPRHLPYGNASPVLAARAFINNQPFVYMFGDDLVLEKKPGNYLRRLIEIYQKYQPGIVLGVQRVPWEEINRYASIRYQKDSRYPHRAAEVLEKLPPDKAPSNVAQFGRFVVSPKIFAVLKNQSLSRDNELWFADAVNTLAREDIAIAEPIKEGEWLTTGDPLRWLKANLKVFWQETEKKTKEEFREWMKKNLGEKK